MVKSPDWSFKKRNNSGSSYDKTRSECLPTSNKQGKEDTVGRFWCDKAHLLLPKGNP